MTINTVDVGSRLREIEGGVPVVAYPRRVGWIPLVGRHIQRALPPKRVKGRPLSIVQWNRFRLQFAALQPDPDVPLAPDEMRERARLRHEVVAEFLGACGLPVRRTLALPGAIVEEIVQGFFLAGLIAGHYRQSSALTPSGSSDSSGSPPLDSARQSNATNPVTS